MPRSRNATALGLDHRVQVLRCRTNLPQLTQTGGDGPECDLLLRQVAVGAGEFEVAATVTSEIAPARTHNPRLSLRREGAQSGDAQIETASRLIAGFTPPPGSTNQSGLSTSTVRRGAHGYAHTIPTG